MTRRQLLERTGKCTLAGGLAAFPTATEQLRRQSALNNPPPPPQLPGTTPLTREGDLATEMVEGIHRHLQKLTAAAVEARQEFWHRDYASRETYEASVAVNRERFSKVIGLRDQRVSITAPSLEFAPGDSANVASGDGYKVYSVRWPVLDGVDGEGLWLEPSGAPVARVVALPDADWSPEMLAGLAPGVPPEAQFARRLAEAGCLVVIPTLLNRDCAWSGSEKLGIFTNLTHREYIYRMAYEIGRHIIGYEVQKVLALVDWFAQCHPPRPVGVMGYGEGGLLALYSAAVDKRIEAVAVSGYFQSRQEVAQEPLYRNVWTLLQEFGDAELAGLIAPRTLVVEASKGPEITGPPPVAGKRRNSAAPGRLVSPQISDVRTEVERALPVFQKLSAADHLSFIVSQGGQGQPGSEPALRSFLRGLGARGEIKRSGHTPRDARAGFDPSLRLHRQFKQLVDFTQRAVIESESEREKFWEKADASSLDNWRQSTEYYRDYLWEEILGKLPEPSEPLSAQTRQLYSEAAWTGYEVLLPLWPDVFAYGILLVPRAIETGERRPVVVCQHGVEGRPQRLIKPDSRSEAVYHHFAAELADHGFVVYCPQDPYIGGESFRSLKRRAHPLKLSEYSFILRQHERMLEWLATQPFVDPTRIGFYGLSYGGKTSLRVPPLLGKYALAICAGDFNEWIWKMTRDDAPFTYIFSPEYEILEFNLGNTFNHSDMAKLMTPRPFMVERGHDDQVSVDSWVAYEYAKVRRHYDWLGLAERTRIEYFNGPHAIHGVGTVDFLHHFLNWGEPFHW